MQLYGLKQLRIVREEKLDTKCLLAWSEDTLVLSFRGTASTRNAISDLQVVPQVHRCKPRSLTMFSNVYVCVQRLPTTQALCQEDVMGYHMTVSAKHAVSDLLGTAQVECLMAHPEPALSINLQAGASCMPPATGTLSCCRVAGGS